MQQKLSHYIRLDTNSHSDSEGSTSGIGTATDNAYHILPASDSPVSSYRFSSSTTTSLVYSNGNVGRMSTPSFHNSTIYTHTHTHKYSADWCIFSSRPVYSSVGKNNTQKTGVQAKQNSFPTNNGDEQLISPLGMAKYLEDKLKAANAKHCDTCMCATRDLRVLADIEPVSLSVETQTMLQTDINYALCLRCNCNLNSPSATNSPYMLNLVKSCDSIMSDMKNSGSCIDSSDNGKAPDKREELMVNPILGHTPIIDRSIRKHSTPNRSATCDISAATTIQTQSKPFSMNNIASASGNSSNSNEQNNIDIDANLMKDDEISLHKEMTRTPTQVDRTTNSSSSLSNRSSVAILEGSKLFESFNRNLIKSIKVCLILMFFQSGAIRSTCHCF